LGDVKKCPFKSDSYTNCSSDCAWFIALGLYPENQCAVTVIATSLQKQVADHN
jgi:hypothetical protein